MDRNARIVKQEQPVAYDGFEGNAEKLFSDSTPWWNPSEKTLKNAPNVVVMLMDDMGYSDLGCYGSEIPTPNIDKLANNGIRYTNFHVTPKCSPTRASLLTGYNHHLVGYADVPHFDPGFPNYRFEIPQTMPTMAQRFATLGYSTLMVGKWHLVRDSAVSVDGPKDSWPLNQGFEDFYGFFDGFTNYHQPHELMRGNAKLDVDEYPEDYYLTDDLTDNAISMIATRKSTNNTRPFFLYFAHAAPHAPLHAKRSDIARHRNRYDAGWDILREQRLIRQKQLGVIPEHTVLPPDEEGGFALPNWSDLSQAERQLYSRYMEVYAAMLDNVDQNVGRLCATLEQMGELQNTVFLFLSDNGASAEGGSSGTVCHLNAVSRHYAPVLGPSTPSTPGVERLTRTDFATSIIDEIGTAKTMPHYPAGWARVSNTPYRLFKKQTYAGGHTVPLVLSWPAALSDKGTLRHQYMHVVDILPTLFDLIGQHEAGKVGDGTGETAGVSGLSMIYDARAPALRKSQYFEMEGNRAYYRDGWQAVSLYDTDDLYSDDWELYNLAADPTEARDVSTDNQVLREEFGRLWEQVAWRNQVFPLRDPSGLLELRPKRESTFSDPCVLWPQSSTLDRYRCLLLMQMRSFDATIHLMIPYEEGDQGVLLAHGDQGGGYILYVESGHLRYGHTFSGKTESVNVCRVPLGAMRFTLSFVAKRGGVGRARIAIDDAALIDVGVFDMLWGLTPKQGIDIGIDRRSPVDWHLRERHGTFPYSGSIKSVHYLPGPHATDSPYAIAARNAAETAAFR